VLLAGLDVADVDPDELVAVRPLVLVEGADGMPDLVDDGPSTRTLACANTSVIPPMSFAPS
jgi:hypothetical protein